MKTLKLRCHRPVDMVLKKGGKMRIFVVFFFSTTVTKWVQMFFPHEVFYFFLYGMFACFDSLGVFICFWGEFWILS